jgi:predicted transposase/invertase (TIGR01784 family)
MPDVSGMTATLPGIAELQLRIAWWALHLLRPHEGAPNLATDGRADCLFRPYCFVWISCKMPCEFNRLNSRWSGGGDWHGVRYQGCPMRTISPINDFFFRYLFGETGHEHLTLDFINAVLSDSGMGPLQKVVVKNPFNIRESVTSKESILDIKAEDEDARIYDIEMQLAGNSIFANRSLYYWARCYTSQIGDGDDYRKLNPVICINVLDFELLRENPLVHSCFVLREMKAHQMVLTDHLMMHFLSLTLFRKMRYTVESPLTDWLTWFCFNKEDEMKGLDTILERNKAVREAHSHYEQFTADRELMEKYEARQKYIRDLSTIKGVSRDEGYQEGLERGIEQGLEQGAKQERFHLARAMKESGESAEKIHQYTGLSIEEIKDI